MSEVGTSLLDLLYPQRCIGCTRFGSWVCDVCRGRALDQGYDEKGAWLGRYSNPTLRSLVGQLKYNSATCLKSSLFDLFEISKPHLSPWLEARTIDSIVPIPGDAARIRERGIDHTQHIAQVVHDAYFPLATIVPALERTKETLTNAQLPEDARLANVAGAFNCPSRIQGSVLLVDDVYTTGVTAQACTQALLTAGASMVHVLSIARS